MIALASEALAQPGVLVQLDCDRPGYVVLPAPAGVLNTRCTAPRFT